MLVILRKFKAVVLVVSVVLASVLWAGPAMAHKVFLFAWVEGNQIKVDSYFSKSRKVIHGHLQVLDPQGRVLLEGETDEQGAFSFDIPQKTDLKLVMEAGMGHRTEFVVPADELPDSVPAASGQATPTAAVQASTASAAATTSVEAVPAATPPTTANLSPVPAPVDTDQLRDVVQTVLDDRLKPVDDALHGLQRSVAMLQEDKGPGMTEIFGGIGWIIGLFGVAAFFRGRSNRRNGG